MTIDQAISFIANKQKQLANTKPVLKWIEVDLIALTRENFANSQAPDGTDWAPINHRFGQPLIDTGYLMRSFKGFINADAGTLSFGTNVEYADDHQRGIGVRKREMIPDANNLPKRYQDVIDRRVNSWLQSVINK
jgi:phage gpG-like protein